MLMLPNNSKKHTFFSKGYHKIGVAHTKVYLGGAFLLWVLVVNFAMLIGHIY
jgi:hypothetical protein